MLGTDVHVAAGKPRDSVTLLVGKQKPKEDASLS